MLTDSELQYMRDSLEQIMPDTCVILAAVNTADGQGGYETIWGTATANVRCRIDPGRKEMYERISGAQLAPFAWFQLTLPHDVTIGTSDRVVVNGETYNVINDDAGKSWQGTIRVALMRVD